MPYIVDADVFIRAKDDHYGFDFCPAFWDWIVQANGKGQVFSIDEVGKGISSGNDELAEWAAQRTNSFFLQPDQQVTKALDEINDWLSLQDYEKTGVENFLEDQDYQLVGHALARGYTVVTHEKLSDSKRRIKIPNVCLGVNVPCMNPFEMLRSMQPQFVLATYS